MYVGVKACKYVCIAFPCGGFAPPPPNFHKFIYEMNEPYFFKAHCFVSMCIWRMAIFTSTKEQR